MAEFEYRNQKNIEYENKIDSLLIGMPTFVTIYERGIEGYTSPYTRLIYLRRIDVFFRFLHESNPVIASKPIRDISYEDLECLGSEDIEEFTHYIRTGSVSVAKSKTSETSVNNYLSALNSLWDYMVSHGKLEHNIIKDVKRARKAHHEVIRLDKKEQSELFDAVRYGKGRSDHANAYKTDVSTARDDALCILMLRTGLRVSEAVSLNIDDINFEKNFVHVLRKESKPDNVYFSDEVKARLLDYIDLRPTLLSDPKEKALFVVSVGKYKGQRMTVRAVQRMVKKYAVAIAPAAGSAITPHKLRASFATDMILATNNLALVQAEMNHESPSTTSIYIDKRAHDLEKHRNDLD